MSRVPGPLPTTPTSTPVPLPAIPVVPSNPPQSMRPLRPGEPIQVVLPVGYVPSRVAMAAEIKPYAESLASDPAPSRRMMAARALALGRHASSDEVKAALFQSVQSDPCPPVRAECIGHLCKLGYFHPAFLDHLRTACEDASEEVREAAKDALEKMSPSLK
jgi:hypothetical protein